MLFMGRGRGRGGGQYTGKSGGIISATTRKEKRPTDDYDSPDRSRSRSPMTMSKRPVLERLGPQREEMSPLRITVGNEIYKERRSRSPLSDRLGPPVKRHDSYDDMKHHSDERYDELYGGLSDEEREKRHSHHRRNRYDSPSSPRRGSRDHGRRSDSYSREWDRDRRSSSRDRDRRSRDRGRHDSNDRDRQGSHDRYNDRDRHRSHDHNSERHDSRDHFSERERQDSYDRQSDRDRGNRDVYERVDSFDEQKRQPSERDRTSYGREDYLRENLHSIQKEEFSRYRIPEARSSQPYAGGYLSPNPYGANVPMQPSFPASGENKPLKSILKKSAPDPAAYTSDAPFPKDIQSEQYSTKKQHEPFGLLNPSEKGTKKPYSKSFSGLPGMSSYMDIEDEERFLYGDDLEEKSKKEAKGKRESSEYLPYPSEVRTSQTGAYAGGYKNDDRYPPYKQSEYQSYGDQRTPVTPQQHSRNESRSDLLSIFASNKDLINPTTTATYSINQQHNTSPSEKKAKYDPTIENILKSIGFDFEMSKRMQEKANPTPVKPKEEVQYGINQASSFLGGELSDDIKKEIFPVKSRIEKESMVDVLLREAKMTPKTPSISDRSKTQRIESVSSRDRRDSLPSSERGYARDSSYTDRKSKQQTATVSQSGSPTYSLPASTYTTTETYPVSTVQNVYVGPSTSANTYPSTTPYSVSGFSSYAPPAPFASPYSVPPPGHPSMWGPPPGHPGYGARFMSPGPYVPPPGYPAGYPPYGQPPPKSGSYKDSSSKMSSDSSKQRDSVTSTTKLVPKKQSNLKTIEITKKIDETPKKTETKTVTVVKKVKKVDSKAKSKGNVVSSTTTGSNRTVLPPKTKTPVKKPSDTKSSPKITVGKEKIVITKVILTPRERERLIKEKEQNEQRLKILEQELVSLRKQQNELMRKKRRVKDGHKDPILMQNSILQDEITKQISKLQKEADEKAKLINDASVEDAGQSTSKRSRESSSTRQSPLATESPAKKPRTDTRSQDRGRLSDQKTKEKNTGKLELEKKRKDESHSMERKRSEDRRSTLLTKSDRNRSSPLTKSGEKDNRSSPVTKQSAEKQKEKPKVDVQKPKVSDSEKDTYKPIKPEKKIKYEFFDPGNHWCRICNVVCSSLMSLLQHFHGQKHQALVNKYDRPWLPEELKSGAVTDISVNKDELRVEVTPIKGHEFFMATKGYFCTLCKEHCGDDISAEYHIKTESHYTKYQDYLKDNPFYEQRLNLDKAAGMSLMKDEQKKDEKQSKKEEVKKGETTPEVKQKEKDLTQEAKKLEQKTQEEVKKGDTTPEVRQKEKNLTGETKKLEQKKKLQAIWDKHITSKLQEKTAENKKNEEEKEKGKIQINIINKKGLKAKQATPAPKKNPVLPPWTPVSKDQQLKSEPVRRSSEDDQEPPSLDDFITVGENKKIPVVNDSSKNIAFIMAESLVEIVSAIKPEETDTKKDNETKIDSETQSTAELNDTVKTDKVNQSSEITNEEKKDLEMLAIDPNDSKPLAEVKPPPPPSQNLSLPTENKVTMATSCSEETYTLFFCDDKQVGVSTDLNQTVQTNVNDLVGTDAGDNVTFLSDDDTSDNVGHLKTEQAEKVPVPLEQSKDSDVVVIALDSQSEGSDTENGEIKRVDKEVEKKTYQTEKTEIDSEKKENQLVNKDINETENKANIETLDQNMGIKEAEDKNTKPQTVDIENNGFSVKAAEESPCENVGSKIEVLAASQSSINKNRHHSQRGSVKNVKEVEIMDENKGDPIHVINIPKEEVGGNPIEVVGGQNEKSESSIEVIQTSRDSSKFQQMQFLKTSTLTRTRELSNLHDVAKVETEKIIGSTSDAKNPQKQGKKTRSSTKKRSIRKKSSEYVPRKHQQVDIVSISDDEQNQKYEAVDSASDFSANEQELENISSSSEKFGNDINEQLENVSSDSEIDDHNDRNDDELENISSDEMEGNIMTVDEVGEVDEFEDFDFHDQANILDQVGDSDDEMEVDQDDEHKMEKLELENISDAEEGDFKKEDEENELESQKEENQMDADKINLKNTEDKLDSVTGDGRKDEEQLQEMDFDKKDKKQIIEKDDFIVEQKIEKPDLVAEVDKKKGKVIDLVAEVGKEDDLTKTEKQNTASQNESEDVNTQTDLHTEIVQKQFDTNDKKETIEMIDSVSDKQNTDAKDNIVMKHSVESADELPSDEFFQPEETIKPVRGRKRGRGRGRRGTRKMPPRRGRSSGKNQNKSETEDSYSEEKDEADVNAKEESTEIMDATVQEVTDETIKNMYRSEACKKNESPEKEDQTGQVTFDQEITGDSSCVQDIEIEDKITKGRSLKPTVEFTRTPRRGRSSAKNIPADEVIIKEGTQDIEVKKAESDTDMDTGNTTGNILIYDRIQSKSTDVEKTVETSEGNQISPTNQELETDSSSDKILQSPHKGTCVQEIASSEDNILQNINADSTQDIGKSKTTDKNDFGFQIQESCVYTENEKLSAEQVLNEVKETEESNTDKEFIIPEDKSEKVLLTKTEEKTVINMHSVKITDNSKNDSESAKEIMETSDKNNQSKEPEEMKVAEEIDEDAILIDDDNDSMIATAVPLDTSDVNTVDDTDILPLEMDDLISLDSSRDSVQNTEEKRTENIKLEDEPILHNIEEHSINIDSELNKSDSKSVVESAFGEVISISDEDDTKSDVIENQMETPVCVELNNDNLETFSLLMKPEISVSFENNKSSKTSNLVDLDFGTVDGLPILQDETARDSDNASSTSEIKIDVVLEAIDSLSGVETSEPSTSHTEKEEIQGKTTEKSDQNNSKSEDNVTLVNELHVVEDSDIKDNIEKEVKDELADESSQEQDMVILSSAVGKRDGKNENPDFKDLDIDDGVSVGSGISMDMGSDFEVLDECESD